MRAAQIDVDELAALQPTDQVAILSTMPTRELSGLASMLTGDYSLELDDGLGEMRKLRKARSALKDRVHRVRRAKETRDIAGLGCGRCGGACDLEGLGAGPCAHLPAGPQRRACREANQARRAAAGGGAAPAAPAAGQNTAQQLAQLRQNQANIQRRISALHASKPGAWKTLPETLTKMQPNESGGTVAALRATVQRLRALEAALKAAPAGGGAAASTSAANTAAANAQAQQQAALIAQRLANAQKTAELKAMREQVLLQQLNLQPQQAAQPAAQQEVYDYGAPQPVQQWADYSAMWAAAPQPAVAQWQPPGQQWDEYLSPSYSYEDTAGGTYFEEEYGELMPDAGVDLYEDAWEEWGDDTYYDDGEDYGDIEGLGFFKKLLKKVAPILKVAAPIVGTAVGGPFGTVIGGMVGQIAGGAAEGGSTQPIQVPGAAPGTTVTIAAPGSPEAAAAAAAVAAKAGPPCAKVLDASAKARCQLETAKLADRLRIAWKGTAGQPPCNHLPAEQKVKCLAQRGAGWNELRAMFAAGNPASVTLATSIGPTDEDRRAMATSPVAASAGGGMGPLLLIGGAVALLAMKGGRR